ncbi:hypothetical protein Acsp05_64550 [Actinokineospora sp. NBRC 105648]|nr:hypothetical protein Acsp05_64550 [Actinokineospora sp. NBRC 105648]
MAELGDEADRATLLTVLLDWTVWADVAAVVADRDVPPGPRRWACSRPRSAGGVVRLGPDLLTRLAATIGPTPTRLNELLAQYRAQGRGEVTYMPGHRDWLQANGL